MVVSITALYLISITAAEVRELVSSPDTVHSPVLPVLRFQSGLQKEGGRYLVEASRHQSLLCICPTDSEFKNIRMFPQRHKDRNLEHELSREQKSTMS